MRKVIRAEYDQVMMFPPCVEDWVPADHPARFIREFVDNLDLPEMGIKWGESEMGGTVFSADILARVWLYGYYERIRSSRRLEWACMNLMPFVFLTGNHAPDHNTLWRFWRENKKSMKRIIGKSVSIGQKSGLIGMVLHAVDGTKIQSLSSRRSAWHKKDLAKLLEAVNKSLEEMDKEIERSEAEGGCEYRMPDEYKDKQRLREEIKKAMSELDEAEREHIHPSEPEARMMKNQRTTDLCYNAQIVVDEKSGMIVAEEVVNDESDRSLLAPMIDAVKENLGEAASETLADGGYNSEAQIAEARSKEYGITVNMGKEDGGEFSKSKFEYDVERDCVKCPLGKELQYEREKNSRNGKYKVKVYRCKCFRDCARANACSKDKNGRSIEISPYHEAAQLQRAKQSEPANKKLLSRRQAIVERPFAVIKHIGGFRRWSVRGLEKVRAQWSMVCAGFNLRILYKSWLRGELMLG